MRCDSEEFSPGGGGEYERSSLRWSRCAARGARVYSARGATLTAAPRLRHASTNPRNATFHTIHTPLSQHTKRLRGRCLNHGRRRTEHQLQRGPPTCLRNAYLVRACAVGSMRPTIGNRQTSPAHVQSCSAARHAPPRLTVGKATFWSAIAAASCTRSSAHADPQCDRRLDVARSGDRESVLVCGTA